MVEIIGQVIGIVAMAFNILSYQRKSARGVIAMQLVGSSLFAASFLMLGAYVGGLLNIVAAIRAVLFYYKEKTRIDSLGWLPVFIGIYLLVYVATFLFFIADPKPLDYGIELLPVIGMVATHLAYRYSEAKLLRRFGLISSVVWLVYNLFAHSIGAICCEALSILSIFIGMLRLDRKK